MYKSIDEILRILAEEGYEAGKHAFLFEEEPEEKSKYSQKEILEALREYIKPEDTIGTIPASFIIEYLDKEINRLNRRSEYFKKKYQALKASRPAEQDELEQRVLNLLTVDWKTIEDILYELNDPKVTRGKLVPRLTKLINEGEAVKELTRIDGGRPGYVYRRG